MSSTPRLFVESDLVAKGFAALDDAQAKYLTRVMRLGEGDHVRVFNGRDGEWDAVIDQVEGRSVLLKAERRLRRQFETAGLILLFAPLKKAQTDFAVEKATELGATVIQPVMTARTQAARVRADRLQKVALEAAEQTERLDLPVIRDAQALDAAIESLPDGAPLIFCDEAGDDPESDGGSDAGRAQPMLAALERLAPGCAGILVGPEGGFSPEERDRLRAHEQAVPVTLGPRILRAETAVVAAMALFQARLGDWRESGADDSVPKAIDEKS